MNIHYSLFFDEEFSSLLYAKETGYFTNIKVFNIYSNLG